MKCGWCQATSITEDPARGCMVCMACGNVVETDMIVSEISFAENSVGGAEVVGQFVHHDGTMSSFGKSSSGHSFGRDPKAITLANGRRIIQGMAGALSITPQQVETALGFFKLAMEHRFIQGRRTEHVAIACLYIMCRREKTTHMLLDFADEHQVNVFVLGSVFLKLCKKLGVRLPIVDPCLYIFRFSQKLEFDGEKATHEVSMTALRLVSRMKRDWMQFGRRPAGLCGAALLLAARLHGYHRTVREVLTVVRVCNSTLRKRLEEFHATPSSALTISQFASVDLEEECNPPSFTRARNQEKEKEDSSSNNGDVSLANIEEMLRTSALPEFQVLEMDAANMAEDSENVEDLVALPDGPLEGDEDAEDLPRGSKGLSRALNTTSSFSLSSSNALNKNTNSNSSSINNTNSTNNRLNNASKTDHGGSSSSASLVVVDSSRPLTMSHVQDSVDEAEGEDGDGDEEDEGEDDLGDINDDEISQFLMSEEEVRLKSELWHQQNADYLKEKELRAIKKDEEAKNEHKKKRRRRVKVDKESATVDDAVHKMLSQKKLSKKINYAALEGLDLDMGKSSIQLLQPSSSSSLPLPSQTRQPSSAPTILTAVPLLPTPHPASFPFMQHDPNSFLPPPSSLTSLENASMPLQPSLHPFLRPKVDREEEEEERLTSPSKLRKMESFDPQDEYDGYDSDE